MLDDALHADVAVVGLAVELEGLVVEGAELVVAADLLLLAGQLQHDEVLGEHAGPQLRVVLVAAGGAVQELLLLVDHVQALLADRVPAVQVPRGLVLRVVEVVAHRALHGRSGSIYYKGAAMDREEELGGKDGDIVMGDTIGEGLIIIDENSHDNPSNKQ